jgi:hypothetical protein
MAGRPAADPLTTYFRNDEFSGTRSIDELLLAKTSIGGGFSAIRVRVDI